MQSTQRILKKNLSFTKVGPLLVKSFDATILKDDLSEQVKALSELETKLLNTQHTLEEIENDLTAEVNRLSCSSKD